MISGRFTLNQLRNKWAREFISKREAAMQRVEQEEIRRKGGQSESHDEDYFLFT